MAAVAVAPGRTMAFLVQDSDNCCNSPDVHWVDLVVVAVVVVQVVVDRIQTVVAVEVAAGHTTACHEALDPGRLTQPCVSSFSLVPPVFVAPDPLQQAVVVEEAPHHTVATVHHVAPPVMVLARQEVVVGSQGTGCDGTSVGLPDLLETACLLMSDCKQYVYQSRIPSDTGLAVGILQVFVVSVDVAAVEDVAAVDYVVQRNLVAVGDCLCAFWAPPGA